MQFVKQRVSLPVENIDGKLNNGTGSNSVTAAAKRRHSPLLPNSLRCIICGPSGCGKTNLLISLLQSPNGLRFENVYIYSRTLDQDKYKYLENILKPIKGLGYYTFSSNEAVIPPNKAKRNSVFIFDDVICDKQNNIRAYFCMWRHRGIDSFYLAQTYTRVPKHLIRDNANFIILFRQDETNLRHIYNDYSVGCDMSFDTFLKMCNICWAEKKYGFVVIDVDSDVNKGRYRKGFDHFMRRPGIKV